MGSKDLWLFFFFLGFLLFNWPMLGVFTDSLPCYLFVMWGVVIAAAGLAISILGRKRTG